MLTRRRETILRIIIDAYVDQARPVGSAWIASRYRLGISSATIRNEMAELEEEGFVTHPHTSAGRIPSDKGYRYYVTALLGRTDLPAAERHTIRHQFHQVEWDLEEWTRLAAAVLARTVQNVAVVTLPRPAASRLKLMQLLSVHELRALLVLMLDQGVVRQQLVPFEAPVSQAELTAAASRLNSLYAGRTATQVAVCGASERLSSLEAQVTGEVARIMLALDQRLREDVYLEGLRHLLQQPEFARSERLRQLLEVLSERSELRSFLPISLAPEEIRVVIGEENPIAALRGCSVVLGGYGVPGDLGGVLAVVGPTRMPYERTIATVRYLAGLMTELLYELRR